MNIQQLLDLNALARKEGFSYPIKRSVYDQIATEPGKHFIGIVGPRGAGKSVLLKQIAAERSDAVYVSADTLEPEADLFALARTLSENFRFQLLLLDEVHFLKNPSASLKQLYDYPSLRVIFTSSVALAIHASAHDLSRRVRLLPLRVFSFREYLRFREGVDLPRLDMESLVSRKWQAEHLRSGHRFEDYLRGGVLPFALAEPDPLPLLANILEKIITKDIPSVVPLTMGELDTIKRLARFVGGAPVDGINYSSLSRNLGITRYKAEQYVCSLERAFVLRQVFPEGTNVLKEPKILMTPPYRLLFKPYQDAIGGLREDFAVETLTQAAIPFHYLKSTRGAKTPDYVVEALTGKLVVEIGGRGKGREQFKNFHADRKLVLAHTLVPDEKRVPLFLLGHTV